MRTTAFNAGTITVNLAVPSTVTGNGTLNLTSYGDLDGATESFDVIVEGTNLITLGGTGCTGDDLNTIIIPAATLSTAAADGMVSITFRQPMM